MNVCSDRSGRNKEIKRIKDVMESNGYPQKFTEKAIRRQMKRGTIPKQKEIDDKKLQTARIPFSTVSARKFSDWRVKQESDLHSSCPTRSDTLSKAKTLYQQTRSQTPYTQLDTEHVITNTPVKHSVP